MSKRETIIWWAVTVLALVFALSGLWLTFSAGPKLAFSSGNEPRLSGKALLAVSEENQLALEKFLTEEAWFVYGIQVVRAYLPKNQRYTLFFKANNTELRDVFNEYMTTRSPLPLPLFTDSAEYNERIIQLFNGKFDCRNFAGTLPHTLFPAAEKITPFICTLPIPVTADNTGDFVGYLVLFMPNDPGPEERKRLEDKISVIARDIYNDDVLLK